MRNFKTKAKKLIVRLDISVLEKYVLHFMRISFTAPAHDQLLII